MKSRIASLPRRDWTADSDRIARQLTEYTRTPNGTMLLRPIQGVALLEAAELGGVVAQARTGAGKTILSGLLPYVMGSARPLLLVPAHLKRKTQNEFRKLRQHFKIPTTIRIETYQKLGTAKHDTLLTTYAPDLIVADEAQYLKNVKTAAVARRVARYLAANPKCRFCCMSGTLTKGSLLDYAHLLVWALRNGAPVPLDPDEQQDWANALDARVQEFERNPPDVLVPHLGTEALQNPRKAFQERLTSTPGVITSVDQYDEVNLTVKPRFVEPSPEIEKAFADLRLLWQAPDGWLLADASFEVWHVARQLALGFYMRHDPRPPKGWYEARAEWCRFVRKIIELNLDGLDTAFQVANAVSAGRLKPPMNSRGVDVYTAWKAVEPTYQPEVYPVWLSDHALQAAIAWGYNSARRGGIIWTEHVPFGEKLSELTGWPYFRELGRDQKRRFIESELVQSNEVVIASIDSNGEGRNLQHKWHRNLIVSPMSSGADWEQVISRTHREGQTRDVTVDYFVACYENYQSMLDAVERCRVAAETTSQSYRLLGCEFVPPTLVGRSGKYTWQRNSKRERVVVE